MFLSCNQNRNNENTLDLKNSIKVENATNSYNALDTKNAATTKSNLLIVRGKSIGGTNLLDDSSTLKKFGEVAYSEAAMGKAWMVWTETGLDAFGKKSTLAVYVTYNGRDMTKQVVKRIRITSPAFKTAKGAHTGMTLEEIQKLYIKLEFDSSMSNAEFARGKKFYNLKNVGISIEFKTINNSQICTAIAIASAEEISNQPYLQLDSAEIQL